MNIYKFICIYAYAYHYNSCNLDNPITSGGISLIPELLSKYLLYTYIIKKL